MATFRQKKLAKKIAENSIAKEPLNAGQLLESVGYAKSVALHKPGEIIDQKGVQEELENLGFDVESAKSVITQILRKGKEENRLRAAQEIFKVSGEYAPEKHLVVTKKIISVDE